MSASEDQPQRAGRHAAPRTPVRVRLRGRALAMAAVPTALLMAAAYTPNPAVAESTAGKPCGTAPATVPDVAPLETPVPKSELPEPPPGPSTAPSTVPSTAPSTGPSTGPSAIPTQTPTTAPTQQPSAPAGTPSADATPTGAASTPATTPSAARSAAPGGSDTVHRAGLIDDVLGGVNHLLDPGGSPSPTPSAKSAGTPAPATTQAPAPAAPAPRAGTPAQPQAPTTGAPADTQPGAPPPAAGSGEQTPAGDQTSPAATAPAAGGPADGTTGKPSGKASPRTAPATPSGAATDTPSSSPSANPNCAVDTSGLTAGAPATGDVVPQQNWTLATSRLALHGAAFHGVYDVRTPTGTKRVLKFVVDTVDIDNLDMSTLQGNGKTFHVKGAPGSTSTMRKGPVTMYVERLSGHLSKVLGLPIPIDLGEITLTPDTLPRWLYDLIGSIPIPLDLELTGVTAKQAGQFGGTLTIPGMRLFNDDAPYSDK
ncbi:hypothetical protein ACFV6D_08560 [Kitasatospora sp. NPDC059812]|uniref:hypothetical protein n=1 Tax=Kitasatospora sp. NPDC059812 TaxID=3346958 RepID=UPI0036465065